MSKRLAILVVVCAVLVACDDQSVDGQVAKPDSELAPYDDEPDAAAADLTADAGAASADAAVNAKLTADASVTADAAVIVVAPCFVAMHRDQDHDGFGESAVTMAACDQLDGFVTNGDDCYDLNAKAFPHVDEGWYDVDRGDASFDYDCDGAELLFDDHVATCPDFAPEDVHCVPNRLKYPYQAGDFDDQLQCYTAIRDEIDADNDGWWGEPAKCGETAPYGLLITYSRETSYQCSEPGLHNQKTQECR